MTFTWPSQDVRTIRTAYLDARRVYRQPAPNELSLTLGAFTQTAYEIARRRINSWQHDVLAGVVDTTDQSRETLALSWDARIALALEDDWDTLSAEAVRTHAATLPPSGVTKRLRVHKSDVARVGILVGVADWPSWVRSAPNDSRRAMP